MVAKNKNSRTHGAVAVLLWIDDGTKVVSPRYSTTTAAVLVH
jgi:hypothetical protein